MNPCTGLSDRRAHSLSALLHAAQGAGPVCWIPDAGSRRVTEKLERRLMPFLEKQGCFAVVTVNWPAWAAECGLDIGQI